MISSKIKGILNNLNLILLLLIIIFAFLIYTSLFWFMQFGIDFTDEGFYIASIANPKLYSWSISQFGFLYHPLFNLVGQNLVILRLVSVLSLFILLFIFSFYFLKYVLFVNNKYSYFFIAISAFAFSTTIVGYYCAPLGFMPTPSYNSLTLKGILITHIGLLLFNKNKMSFKVKLYLVSLILGLGLWLTFMGKPPSALFFWIMVVLYLFFTAREHYLVLISITFFVFIILIMTSALYIDGSIYKFFLRYRSGLLLTSALQDGHLSLHSVLINNIPYFNLSDIMIFIFVVCYNYAFFIKISNSKINNLLNLLLILGSILVLIAFYSDNFIYGFGTSQSRGIVSLGMVLSLLLVAVFNSHYSLKVEQFKNCIKSNDFKYGLLLLISPYIYVIGTNVNYWMHIGALSIFWLFSVILFTKNYILSNVELIWVRLLILTEILSIFILNEGLAHPYRQNQPIKKYDYEITIGPNNKTKLIVSRKFGEHIQMARHYVYSSGFKLGDPIYDLTGRSPTLIYSIGGINISQPWVIGQYPGSDEAAKFALSQIPCKDLSSMWLLVEDEGPRSISTDVIKTFGANIDSDYLMIAKWKVDTSIAKLSSRSKRWNKNNPHSYFKLYKPISHQTILNKCSKLYQY